VVGIVSEADLIHRVEIGTIHKFSWWHKLVNDKGIMARDYLKSHGTRAADVMTRRVIVAPPDMPLDELALVLERHRIRRVPVVDHTGKLIGIVSRANLVQALATIRSGPVAEPGVPDSILRDRIHSEIMSHLLADVSQVNVVVHDGLVELWGDAASQDEKDAICLAAELVPGVRKVEDHIAICDKRYRF
jgi:CBS domain-containing protein